MDKESLLSRMNEGRTAGVLLQWMDPFFNETAKDVLDTMKARFRAGQYTEQVLACHVAQLIAIDDLRSRIRGKMNQGDSAAQTIHEEDHGFTEPELA